MKLRSRPDTDVATAAAQLNGCAQEGRNVAGNSAGQQGRTLVSAYLGWKARTEAQLRNIFTDPGVLHHMRSPSSWAIRDPNLQSFRAPELVNSEINEQVEWLAELVGDLQRLAARLAAAPGVITVLDTNVLLHYQAPAQVDWRAVVNEDQVRLVLPLRVIEELDERKYRGGEDIRDRARRLLSDLWSRLANTAGAPVILRDGVTIEIPVDDEDPRQRMLDADQEILDTCQQLRNVRQRVILVTGDTGMSLRATALRIEVVRMPDAYLRVRSKP